MTTDIDAHLGQIDEVGYTIVEDAIDPDLVDSLDTTSWLEQNLGVIPADNAFEGVHTTRIHNLLAPDRVRTDSRPPSGPADLRTGTRPRPACLLVVLHSYRPR